MLRVNIRGLAKQKNYSQSKLSRLADIDVRVIQRIYSHPETNITLHTLEKLARALDVHPCDLLEYVKDKENTSSS